jgi:hypothetical protein
MAEGETKGDKKAENGSKKSIEFKKEHKEVLAVALAVIVVLLAYGIGYNCANHRNNHKLTQSFMARGGFGGPVTVSTSAVGAGGTMAGAGEEIQPWKVSASAALEDNHFDGVVTAVSGSNFTIGGSGASTSIVTSSSTTYQSGNTVKLNDSVVVIGTKSGDTITATRVIINP